MTATVVAVVVLVALVASSSAQVQYGACTTYAEYSKDPSFAYTQCRSAFLEGGYTDPETQVRIGYSVDTRAPNFDFSYDPDACRAEVGVYAVDRPQWNSEQCQNAVTAYCCYNQFRQCANTEDDVSALQRFKVCRSKCVEVQTACNLVIPQGEPRNCLEDLNLSTVQDALLGAELVCTGHTTPPLTAQTKK